MMNMMRKRHRKAFTLFEMMITTTIVLIIATTAAQQSISLQRALQFKTAFDQTAFFFQRARTLAVTNEVDVYGVQILINSVTDVTTVRLYQGTTGNVLQQFTTPTSIHVDTERGGSDCPSTIDVGFAPQTGAVRINCAQAGSPPPSVVIGICRVRTSEDRTLNRCGTNPKRSIVIHQASGVPQILR